MSSLEFSGYFHVAVITSLLVATFLCLCNVKWCVLIYHTDAETNTTEFPSTRLMQRHSPHPGTAPEGAIVLNRNKKIVCEDSVHL